MTLVTVRALVTGLLGLFLCLPASAQDQPEPPVRLKKKVRAEPEPPAKAKRPAPPDKPPPKPEERKVQEETDDPNADPRELEQKIHELMNRLSKNLRAAENRLTRKDAGDGTQQVQHDIVKDLEELIAQSRQQQQQQQQQQGSGSSSASGQQSQQARRNRQRQNRSARVRRPQPRPELSQQMQTGTASGGGNGGRGDKNKIADLYKDVWGHLPEALRQEMDQYSREQFMAKYNDLLKQYYSTIAEKGQRKDSPR
jgi:hypothetical protein